MLNKSRGRPPGGTANRRAAILKAAAASFVANGYAATTLRSVATAAECDVALVPYYFGTKAELFAAAMEVSIGPSRVLSHALRCSRAETASALAHAVVETWESPHAGPQLQRLAREAVGHPELRNALSGYLDREVLTPLAEFLGGLRGPQHAAAILNVVAGFIFTRYILEIPTPRSRQREQAIQQLTAQIASQL